MPDKVFAGAGAAAAGAPPSLSFPAAPPAVVLAAVAIFSGAVFTGGPLYVALVVSGLKSSRWFKVRQTLSLF